jgi:hypothetical protein
MPRSQTAPPAAASATIILVTPRTTRMTDPLCMLAFMVVPAF